MLDALEQHPSDSLLRVIQQYTAGPSALSAMLGFKFESYAVGGTVSSLKVSISVSISVSPCLHLSSYVSLSKSRLTWTVQDSKETPRSLYLMAARLVKAEVVTFAALEPYLTPSFQDTTASFNAYLEETLQAASKVRCLLCDRNQTAACPHSCCWFRRA